MREEIQLRDAKAKPVGGWVGTEAMQGKARLIITRSRPSGQVVRHELRGVGSGLSAVPIFGRPLDGGAN